MFLNTFASTEDQLFKGKYKNIKVPPNTDRQGPLESLNSSYDKSSRVRLPKPQHNIIVPLGVKAKIKKKHEPPR